jgi:hypothetical protein
MQEPWVVAAGILVVVHGLIHLMGTTVYMELGTVEGLPYKTTLLGGRWELGAEGIRRFGALWLVPAVGFALAGTALIAGWSWPTSLLVILTVFSLALTLLDWDRAFAGAVFNAAILAAVWAGPSVAAWISE